MTNNTRNLLWMRFKSRIHTVSPCFCLIIERLLKLNANSVMLFRCHPLGLMDATLLDHLIVVDNLKSISIGSEETWSCH